MSHLKNINIEFTTFLIKKDMEDEAEKWMNTLISRRNECVATLREEKMHFESIFKTVRDGRLYLSWFSVQGVDGKPVEKMEDALSKLHVEFGKRCIDFSVKPEDMEHVVSFIPYPIEQEILRINNLSDTETCIQPL